MNRHVVLVRHPAVIEDVHGICYGTSDVPLSRDGLGRIADIVNGLLVHHPITHIYHSGLQRTAILGQELAARRGIQAVTEPRLKERCFGTWELRSWDDIYAETRDAMMGMVQAPATWRPPGGETTFELRDRVLAWYADLPPTGHIVAVTHAGPIAVLQGTVAGLPVDQWFHLIPTYGQSVCVGEV